MPAAPHNTTYFENNGGNTFDIDFKIICKGTYYVKKTKKVIILFSLILCITAGFTKPMFAAPIARLEISISKNGTALASAYTGDVVKATVSMTDFPKLSVASPSLHFAPDVVKVCDASGNIIQSGVKQNFFEKGGAFNAANWGCEFPSGISSHPYLNNETGVIGMYLDSPSSKSLVGTQTIYSIYFKAISAGNADIRLTDMKDGSGKANPLDYYDSTVFLGNSANYAIYDMDITNPLNPTYSSAVNFTAPTFYIALNKSPAEIFKSNGTKITGTADLKGNDEIYATLDMSGYAEPATLVFAVYDDSKLYAIDIPAADGNKVKSRNIVLPKDISKCTVKVMIWDGIGTMRPKFEPLLIGRI